MKLASRNLWIVLLVGVLAASALHAQPQDEDLIGLWSFETLFGRRVHGEIAVGRTNGVWHASFAGLDGRVEVKGETVRVDFANGVGSFRGAPSRDERAIEGYWLQPAASDDPRHPAGASQAFATPLVLKRTGPNQWSGEVHPLEDRFKLYLKVFRSEEGALLGAFRDPYLNENGGASRLRVTRESGKVVFSKLNNEGGYDKVFDAALLHGPDRLALFWPSLDRKIELQRRTPEEASAFFPRRPSDPAYRYEKPPSVGDGWRVARGRDVGVDEAALARAVQKIIDGDPAARAPSLVHSILVARRGKLILEEYFFGFDRETPHDLRSAGKTFASVMLGAAMMQGTKISPNTPLYPLLADRGSIANPDPRKAKITLAHLMTHTPGLACNDNDERSPGNEMTMQTQTEQLDWWNYTLDLPVVHEPGTRYAYCSANMNLMSAALTTATKTWLPELFDRSVARPLGFARYHWNLTPTGEGYLGGGAWMLPRDLLKVGQAYLDGGEWRGRRIVDEEWVAASTAARIRVSPETTGLSSDEFGNFYGEGADAYAWHLGVIRVGDRAYPTYEASGNGGQLLIVAPELDLVVAFTGGNYRQGGVWGRWRDTIIGAEIAPGISN